jgi:streptomycin 6-kinase
MRAHDSFHIPNHLIATVSAEFGEAGVEWSRNLPRLLGELCQILHVTLDSPFPSLSFNCVAPGIRSDGLEVVLKVGVPTREVEAEIAALRLWAGNGCVELLEAIPEKGALLLERLRPGTPLAAVDDEDLSVVVVADIMRQLWRPPPEGHSFPTVSDWGKNFHLLRECFGGTTGPFPAYLVERAEALFEELGATMGPALVLHGDLHPLNICRAERQPWLAIDPKGVVGEAEYEVGAFLRNPLPELLLRAHPEKVLRRRVEGFVERLGLDRGRVVAWNFAQAVLAAWWDYHPDGSGWRTTLAYAELAAQLPASPPA